jgi:long-chain acyl-CoA synthetase
MKWPKTIGFIAEMPPDPAGQQPQRELREPYWAGRERPL